MAEALLTPSSIKLFGRVVRLHSQTTRRRLEAITLSNGSWWSALIRYNGHYYNERVFSNGPRSSSQYRSSNCWDDNYGTGLCSRRAGDVITSVPQPQPRPRSASSRPPLLGRRRRPYDCFDLSKPC